MSESSGRTASLGRAVAVLVSLCAVLWAVRIFALARLAALGDSDLGDRRVLVADLQDAFVAYWRSGATGYPPDLARVVDYWARYELLDAVLMAVLLAALVALGLLLSGAALRGDLPGRGRRLIVAVAGPLVWGAALVALWTLTASIQGAAAPFGALLPLLHEHAPDGALSETIVRVRHGLDPAASADAPPPPALVAMVDDYARFHVVHAIMAAPTALLLLGAAVVVWRRAASAATQRRGRRTMRAAAALCVLLSLAFGVICAANVTTAADPEPGLLGFFEGGSFAG